MSRGRTDPLLWFPWLWPVAAGLRGAEAAIHDVRHAVETALSTGQEARPRIEPAWSFATHVALELPTMRLRTTRRIEAGDGRPVVIVAPYALHAASVADLAPGHSLVGTLAEAGLGPLFVTDWRSATAEMSRFSIDTHLAELAVAIDDIGGRADLIGLCQGGWLSMMFAARFPGKVRQLVLAGAPIDLDAAPSPLVAMVRASPGTIEQLTRLGDGRVLGDYMAEVWNLRDLPDREAASLLETSRPSQQLLDRFRTWNLFTVDLPGTYFRQVVEELFRENRLARGAFTALGRRLDLGTMTAPLCLLGGRRDVVTPSAQVLAAARLVGTPPDRIMTIEADAAHLPLFMGARTLGSVWPRIIAWLREPQVST